MKIEKINENQIRCFLTQDDLAARQMKISELAYGTEKARTLFRDMMRFARKNCGFEAEDLPLMVEAIPLSSDTILLTITKVAFPEELDSRFAYFSDPGSEDNPYAGTNTNQYDSVDLPSHKNADDILTVIASGGEGEGLTLSRHFIFPTLDTVFAAAKAIPASCECESNLYKDSKSGYHLLVSIGNQTPMVFNKLCNTLAEYGIMESPDFNTYPKITEHSKFISGPNALQDIASL